MRTRITRGSAAKGTAEKRERREHSSDSYEVPRRNFGRRYGEFEEKKSSSKNGDKPFAKRGEKPFGKEKPFGHKSEKPFGKSERPFSKGDKPFSKSSKPFGKSEKPFGKSDKPFGKSEKPFGKGEKPFGKGDSKFKKSDKPFGKSERPFGKRDEKPFGRKGADKSFAAKGERPFKKRAPKVVDENIDSDTFTPSITGDVRLNKFIANSGVCSRREADEYIAAGLVTVNGEVVTELGSKVNIDDDVRFNGERLKGEKKVYIMLNKPKDFVTTTSDPHAEKNVMDLISKDLCPQRIFPVGRLDKSTTGILLLTNDGNLTEMLTHPSYGKKKIYEVTLDKNVKQPDFDALLEGFELEDGFIAADAAAYGAEKNIVGVEIHSGKNRIVRRMFEHLGYNVKKLDRVYFAGLTKKNLKRGQWRFLTDTEVAMLKVK